MPSEQNSMIQEMLKKINDRDNIIKELENKVKYREEILS
jgi:hypothetical protein